MRAPQLEQQHAPRSTSSAIAPELQLPPAARLLANRLLSKKIHHA
jgi:hypothetical protein